MTTFLVFSNLVAWCVAALCLVGGLLARKNARHWYRRFKETHEKLVDTEHHNSVTDTERAVAEWHRKEAERLRAKCDAICSGIRKLKGRGQWTCTSYPVRNF